MSYNLASYQFGGLIMKNRIQLFSLLIVMILTACAPKPVAPLATAAGPLPNALVTIEAAAEDIIDFAPSGNWDKINQDVTDIEAAWKSYEPRSKQDGAAQEVDDLMNSALAALETASQSKDASGTMQGSNDVSAAVAEL